MRYSPSMRGFYDDQHPAVPADALPVSVARHAALMQAQSQGAEIVPGPDGTPVESWRPALSAAELLMAERAGMRCSRFQARAALHQAGLLDAAEAAVLDADTLTQIAWADAAEWRRDSPTIATIAASLDLTETQIDDLFRMAARIVA